MDQSTGKYQYPVFQYSNFDVSAICRLAGEMRRLSCTCDLHQRPMRGGFNWAVFVLFAYGIQWVLRSPAQNHPDLSERSVVKLLLSEAATLRYLKIYTDIPVPDVYSYCAYRNNPVRIPYILMSKAQGQSLNTMWENDDLRGRLDSLEMNKVMSQLGQITWDLAQVRFPLIGSLFEQNGSFIVGECLSKGHIQHKRHSLEGIPRGPFDNESKFYHSLIVALTKHAEKLPLGHHCFAAPVPSRNDYANKDLWQCARDLWNQFVTVGQKVDSAANRVDYVIAANVVRHLISEYERNWSGATFPVGFPLCHPDLTMSNIFVDDQYNITCIIDWGLPQLCPFPCFCHHPGFLSRGTG